MHRDSARDILQAWEDECLTGSSIRDQSALAVVLQRRQAYSQILLLPGFHDEFVATPLIPYTADQVLVVNSFMLHDLSLVYIACS